VCAASAELALPDAGIDEPYCGQDEARRQLHGDCLLARACFSLDRPMAAFALFSLWRHSGMALGLVVEAHMQWPPPQQWFSALEMAVFGYFDE